jgi:hypothetical protein
MNRPLFSPTISFAPLDASRGAVLAAEWEADDDWSPIDDADFGGPEGAEEGATGPRLDNKGVSLHPPTPQNAKKTNKSIGYEAFTERSKARILHKNAGAKSAAWCGMKVMEGRADLVRDTIKAGPKAGQPTGRILGVSRCSSPWLCPVCGPRIALKRAEDLKPQIDGLVENGWSAWLITLTARHKKIDRLENAFSLFQIAWSRLTSGKAFNKKRAVVGGLEYVRGYDLTYGKNGWHLHFHLVLLVGPNGDTGEETADWLLQRWTNAIENAGGSVLARALDKRPAGDAAAAAAYAMTLAGVAKHKDREAAQEEVKREKVAAGFSSVAEATAAAAKRGRNEEGGMTAADLRQMTIENLEKVDEWQGKAEAAKAAEAWKEAEWCEEQAAGFSKVADKWGNLYREFVVATLGKRAVVVSQGVKLTPEEQAAEEEDVVMPDIVAYLRQEGLRLIDRDIADVLGETRASVERGRSKLEALLGPPGDDRLWRIPTDDEEEQWAAWGDLCKEAKALEEEVKRRRQEEQSKRTAARRKRIAARKKA